MNNIETMKLALEAFEWNYNTDLDNIPACEQWAKMLKENITALRQAIEQAQQAEPVAWSHAGAMPPEQEAMKEAAYQLAPWLSAALDDPKVCKEYKDVINAWFDAAMPTPPRQPLTDEELFKLWDEDMSCDMPDTFTQFKHTARAIEAAHGIKGEA